MIRLLLGKHQFSWLLVSKDFEKLVYSKWTFFCCVFTGVPKSDLLHTRSLRGHRDCFEKFHLIANQDCPRSKLSKSPYAEVKNILSKKINWIIQYAQNKDLDSDPESSKTSQHQLFNFRHQTDRKLLPQFDSPVPRYSAKWIDGNSGGISSCSQTLLEQRESTDFKLGVLPETSAPFCCSSVLWSNHSQVQKAEKAEADSLTSVRRRHPQHSREECKYASIYTQPGKQGHSLNYLLNHLMSPQGINSYPEIQLFTVWTCCKICDWCVCGG